MLENKTYKIEFAPMQFEAALLACKHLKDTINTSSESIWAERTLQVLSTTIKKLEKAKNQRKIENDRYTEQGN